MKDTMNIRDWAFKVHDEHCNQKYDNVMPYSQHLKFVAAQAYRFKHLWPETTGVGNIYYCCLCHDIIEDGRISYNDLKAMAGEEVAEVVFLLTENKGRTRAERHGAEYYIAISNNKIATFIKLCDIIANVLYSTLSGSSMLRKYREEYPAVEGYLYCEEYKEVFDYLKNLLDIK